MMRQVIVLLGFLLAISSGTLNARNFYVNNVNGNDANAADRPEFALRSIRAALKLVRSGDTIHLTPTDIPYRESIGFTNNGGTKEAPIIIDGHEATLCGAEPLREDEWMTVSPGLYKNDRLYTVCRFNLDVISRYFIIFNRQVNRMGRCLKGKSLALKKVEELQEGEWSFVWAEKAFYIKIAPARKLVDYRIELPVRANGVSLHGTSDYIIIRNMTTTHFYNDGYGLSGTGKKLLLENIRAIECGDDGISAHAFSGVKIRRFHSIGNGTGICDTGNSDTDYEDVVIEKTVGIDLYFLQERNGLASHRIKNAVIIGHGNKQLIIDSPKPDSLQTVEMDNVLFLGRWSDNGIARVGDNCEISLRHCFFLNLDWAVAAKAFKAHACLFTDCGNGMTVSRKTEFIPSGNFYAVHHLKIGSIAYGIWNEGNYAKELNDATSRFAKSNRIMSMLNAFEQYWD